eukprot:TRINITY_DN1264_c0_g1_i2.p1 TRINITY_DN1264_c0_g1~~TRINITY_DN1264_c0_g1_i2.p1  ORF type:complete len:412 (+),score=65.05 TRINITY_DN1264_c0_g1_i2:123-1358(+)
MPVRWNHVLVSLVVCAMVWRASFVRTEEWHSTRPVKPPSEGQTWTIITSTANPTYAYFAPIAAISWTLHGVNVIVFLFEVNNEWETNPRLAAVLRQLEKMENVFPVKIPVQHPNEAVAISQVSRLLLPCMDDVPLFGLQAPVAESESIEGSDFVCSSDVDMIVIDAEKYILPAANDTDPLSVYVFTRGGPGPRFTAPNKEVYRMFSMCYVCYRKSLARRLFCDDGAVKITDVHQMQEQALSFISRVMGPERLLQLDRLKGPPPHGGGRTKVDRSLWYLDQQALTYILQGELLGHEKHLLQFDQKKLPEIWTGLGEFENHVDYHFSAHKTYSEEESVLHTLWEEARETLMFKWQDDDLFKSMGDYPQQYWEAVRGHGRLPELKALVAHAGREVVDEEQMAKELEALVDQEEC